MNSHTDVAGKHMARTPAMHIGRTAEATVYIDAPPHAVWEAVADIARQTEWSCEATRMDWIPPAREATVGARFRGSNHRGIMRWTRENEVLEADPERVFSWRTLPTRLYPDSTIWRIELRPSGAGTEVRESFQVVKMNRAFEIMLYWINPVHRNRSGDLAGDLARLKTFVESRA